MTATLLQRRTAQFAVFFAFGVAMSSWVSRTPDIRDLVGATTLQMGAILFGLSIGSMIGVLPSGPIVARFGSRRIIAIGGSAVGVGLLVVALGALAASGPAIAGGLLLLGLGVGGSEVAVNVEGAEIEAGLRRSTLPLLHGFYSLGTLAGAVVGIAMTALAVPVALHLGAAAVLALGTVLVAHRRVPADVGRVVRAAPHADRHPGPRPAVWRDPRLLLIGVVILGLALAEGSANDWLPLVMVDGHGVDAALGTAVYTAFALAMTAGRLFGGGLVDRFGALPVLAVSALVSAVGIAVVVFVDAAGVAAAGAVLWGLGAALGFPVALSAAADSGPEAQARVSLAATLGYVAFLVGPPGLGFLGDHLGLRTALVAVLVLVVAAALAAAAARRPARAETAVAPGTGGELQP